MSLANILIILALVGLGIAVCQLGYELIKMRNDVKLIRNFLYKSIKLTNVTDSQANKNDSIIGIRQFKTNNQSDDSNISNNTKEKLNICKDYLTNIFASLSSIIRHIKIPHKRIKENPHPQLDMVRKRK